jgi:Asp-tRNA(Asn)/Glu-tRNA(Gln) amidotransferase A subunit family amidase
VPAFDDYTRFDAVGLAELVRTRQVHPWNAEGLPIGLQFAAKMGDEATLFRLAAQLEQAKPWADHLPMLPPVG